MESEIKDVRSHEIGVVVDRDGREIYSAGGVVGSVGNSSVVVNCYSTSVVSGREYVGGVVGIVFNNGNVANCAALNPEVKKKGTGYAGRVAGSITYNSVTFTEGTLSNNVAYTEMINNDGNTIWLNKGAAAIDGEDIISTSQTIGGRFTEANGWTTGGGKLPGLFGETVDMPAHLNLTTVAVASTDRIIPPIAIKEETAVVAPADVLIGEFTAGPNPIRRGDHWSPAVNFYRHGKRINTATLSVYDVSGNFIRKIAIRDNTVGTRRAVSAVSASGQPRRQVGSWDLKDARGGIVGGGAYLVRGVITASDGKRERVSVVVVVR